MGGKKTRSLKARVGLECCISRDGPDGPGSTVEVPKLEESEEEDTALDVVGSPKEAGRADVRAASSFESRKGEKRAP